MTDYLDRVEAQLVARAEVLYAPRRADPIPGDAHGVLDQGALRALTAFCSAALGTLVVAVLMLVGANPAPSEVTVVRGKGGLVTIGAAGPSGLAAMNRTLALMGIPVRGVEATCSAPVRDDGVDGRRGHSRTLELPATRSTTPTFGQLVAGSIPACVRGTARAPALVAAPS